MCQGVSATGKVILVASGKGGVGKSMVTANLGAALAERHSVLVIDADLEMANLDLMLGCRDRHVYDLQDVYLGRCVPADALCSVPGHAGLTALFAPLRLEASVPTLIKYIRRLAEDLRRRYDFILVDCPSGVGSVPEAFADPRFEALIVATPDRTSISDAERMADCFFRRAMGRVRLIVNRVRPGLIRKGLMPDIDTIIDATSLQLIGLIPEDIAVIRAGNCGQLAYDLPRARCKTAVFNIARRLEGTDVALSDLK